MEELTENQQKIYNLYLKHLALSQNRPYNKRKDFSNISDDIKTDLVKLDLFFQRNPEINEDLFFKSGFANLTNSYLHLGFFHTYIAVKSYSKFIKERYNTFIDSDESVNDFIEGLKFIINFVRENKIKLHDYPKITNDKGIFQYLIHLKKQYISLYHLHAFHLKLSDLYEDEILNIYLEDFKKKFFETQRQYNYSKRLKNIGNKLNEIKQN